MRNPELINKVDNIYADNGQTILDIPACDYFEKAQYDLLDDKSFKNYMKALENAVRHSFAYRQMIYQLKYTDGMNECSFLENVSCVDNNKVKIEIHHEPFTLYDICYTVFKRRQTNGEDLRIPAVAEEVMWLHYCGLVGLVPLSSTIHDLVHNQYLFVPTDIVRGNYREFVNMYYNHIEPDVLDYLDAAELATKEGTFRYQMEMFNVHNIYINCNGSYGLPDRNQVVSTIRNRVDVIKSKTKLMFKYV